jgi:hypothetical protein
MPSDSYRSLCDEFYIEMYVNTELDLPTQRDTILTFFERLQRQFPSMGHLYRRAKNEYCLEEDRNLGQYRWISLEVDRVGSGIVNPLNFEQAYGQDRLVLELMPYMLGVSQLDIDCLDVTFAMDFDYAGNHDEVIAEALFGSTPFGCFLDLRSAKPIGFSPAVVVALSDDERTQARISVESKTSVLEPRQKSRSLDEAITLSLTIRQYPPPSGEFDTLESFGHQCRMVEELMDEKLVPYFAQPLTEVIAQKRLT